ncbi:MAG: hypothetical protein IKO26_01295 [Paludibacteraceae bacterium]|nr:hypothetical protein [Paludibacteraceae bacterium]
MRKKISTFLFALAASVGMMNAAMEGKLPGAFSVDEEGTRVYFSKGNLQYNSNNQQWQFADKQFGYVGSNAAGNTSVNETGIADNSGIVDLFCWVGASSGFTGLAQYGITSSSDYSGYGSVDEPLKSDWGTTINTDWRTLTLDEWGYIFTTNTPGSSANGVAMPCYTMAKILTDGDGTEGKDKNICGVILFPDDFNDGGNAVSGVTWGTINDAISDANNRTQCTTEGWNTLENMGCVFLPDAGMRWGSSPYTGAGYWSSSLYSDYSPYALNVNILSEDIGFGVNPRYLGFSVRLVTSGIQTVERWEDTEDLTDSDDARWTGSTGVVGEGETVKFGELYITSGTDENRQQLTVQENATLEVAHLTMNDYAQIIVEEGGKLIVTSEQGIDATSVDNILLKTSGTAQAALLFNPEVTTNCHPSARLVLRSQSFKNDSKWFYQRFGVPMYNSDVTVKPLNEGSVRSFIKQWDYAADDWSNWTEITGGHTFTDAVPFRGYMLGSDNAKNAPMTYEFAGQLVGNENANLHFYYGWNFFANSYAAPIAIKEFINTVQNTAGSDDIQATVYLYQNLGNDTYTWQAVNLSNAGTTKIIGSSVNGPIFETYPSEIKPMQAFLMQLRAAGKTFDQTINYKDDVYNPAMGIAPNAAPARNMQSSNKMNMAVCYADGYDNISFIESSLFSNDLDNGYDAVKYMNTNSVKLYAMNNEEPMAIVATDNVDGTFIGIDAPKAGNYTMYFYGINGMEYMLVDMQTGAVVKVEEGARYDFFAGEGRNDHRFQIVGVNKIPTAIEQTEAGKSMKGIYTVTGQYLGEDFNVLPKGLYIVNGVKIIK